VGTRIDAALHRGLASRLAITRIPPFDLHILAFDPRRVIRFSKDESSVHTAAQVRHIEGIDTVTFESGCGDPIGLK
jgi:hypothetical protein